PQRAPVLARPPHLDPGGRRELLEGVDRWGAEETFMKTIHRGTGHFPLRGRHLAGIRRCSRHLSGRLLLMPAARVAWLHVTHTCEDIGTFLPRRRTGVVSAGPTAGTRLFMRP